MAHTTLTNTDTSLPAIADEFPAHYDVPRNATLLPVLSRPIQIHAAVMPICLLLLVGRRNQTSHIHRYSSDGSLVVGVLPPISVLTVR